MSNTALSKQDTAAPAPDAKRVCWGITDGTAGVVAQVRALAAALKLTPVMKKVVLKAPYVWLPNACYDGGMQQLLPRAVSSFSDALTPPWPDLIISCGRRGALAALSMKPRTESATRFVHIHDPQMGARHFDAVIAMEHDKITGDNVIKTRHALHTITPDRLAEAEKKFAKRFSLYPKPYVAVLFGGSTNKYALKPAAMHQAIMALQQLANNIKGSLLVTVSRRTGEQNLRLLLDAFPRSRESKIYIYDGIGDNPYLGMLAAASHIVVTNDSVNMMSEAAATGKPLYILKLPGHKDTKPARFAEKLIAENIARPFADKLETWTYPANDEMEKVASAIRQRLAW